MKKQDQTIILNRINSNDFLDLNNPEEFKKVIEILNKTYRNDFL